jgi:hypothetical protein
MLPTPGCGRGVALLSHDERLEASSLQSCGTGGLLLRRKWLSGATSSRVLLVCASWGDADVHSEQYEIGMGFQSSDYNASPHTDCR